MRKRSKKRHFYSGNKRRKAGRTGGPVSGLFFFGCYFCGILGYLLLCSLIFRLNYSWRAVVFVLSLACLLCWVLQDILKWKPFFIILTGIAGAGGMFLIRQSAYLTNMKMLYAAGMWNMRAIPVIEVTGLLCICVILGLLLMYLTVSLAKQGWIFYFITFSLVFAAMMQKAEIKTGMLCLLAVFHLGNRMEGVAAKTDQKPGQTRRSIYKNAGRVIPVLAVFLLLAMGIAQKGAAGHMETLYETPLKTGDRVWRLAAGMWLPESLKGQINRGGLYPSGREQMEVIVSGKPEEALYLKNFVGDVYENGSWKVSDREEFYESLDGQYAAQEGADARKYFENRQFYMIRYILANMEGVYGGENMPGEKNVELKSLAAENRTASIPYIYGEEYGDDKVHRGTMYTEQDFKEVLAMADADTIARFEQEESAYKTFVEQSCLTVPEEEVPRLVRLCGENEKSGAEEVSGFIRSWLQSKAAYSLNPGVVPIGKDPAEYFIFEQGKGYCQHFATAAALMFRSYGIPSRYAVGFRVTPDLFEQQEDGRYRAVVTDEQAHAWAEIYSGGEGWIPVETTPAAGELPAGAGAESEENMPNAETAAGTAGEEDETGQEPETEQEDPNVPNEMTGQEQAGNMEDADETKADQKDGSSGKSGQSGQGNVRSFFLRMAPVFAVIGLIVFVWGSILLRRYLILCRQEKYGTGQIMVRMLEVLGLAGEMKECDAMGADFPESLSNAVPSVTKKEAGQIQRAALQESFGKEELSGMQGRDARRVYKKVCAAVYERLPWYKKIYFRYGKVYR